MKKSFLALAVAALAATSISTASAATVYDKDGTSLAVYGRVQSVLYSDKAGVTFNNGDKSDENATLKTSGRLGVDMRTQVYGDIAAFAKMEWDVADGNVDADKDDSFGARYLWVGLDFAQAGQVKFGRFEPAIKYAISQTDIFDDWGCNGLAGNDDKRKSMLQYSWAGYGFDAIVSYGFANKGEHVDGAYGLKNAKGEITESADLDYSVSLAAGYTSPDVVFGPIAVRAGYEKVEFADSTANKIGTTHFYDSYNQYAIGLSWGSLNLGPYVAAVYQNRDFDVKGNATNVSDTDYSVSGYEFVVGYAFANGISARAGYTSQTVEIDALKVDVEANTVPVYVNWQLNPQVNVWAEARFDASTDEDEKKAANDFASITGANYGENVYSAGIRYQF